MSDVDKLLDSLTDDEKFAYAYGAVAEPHIVIGEDRRIVVPPSLRRLAVQHDHNIETVTFDCPRYWDNHDMSKMQVYINYILPDGETGSLIGENVTAEENIMHFDWTISRNITGNKGNIIFLVCVKKTDAEGNEVNHWNSERCEDCYISEGLEAEETVVEEYPDIVTQLLTRMDTVEQINVQAENMQELYDATVEVAETAEQTKNEALDASNYIKNSYAPAIKGNVSGNMIRVDDVSPITHNVKCIVRGKNLFDISKITNATSITNNGDGSLTIAANSYYTRTNQKLSDICPQLRVGDVATLSFTTNSSYSRYIYLHGLQRTWNNGDYITITQEILDSYVCFYGYTESDPLYGQENVISNVQIEIGKVATTYEPYINPATTGVFRFGKNLFDCFGSPRVLGHSTVVERTHNMITVTGPTMTWQAACFALPSILVGCKVTISGRWISSGENKGCLRMQWVNNVGTTLGDIIAITNQSGVSATGVVPEMPDGAAYLVLFVYSNSDGNTIKDGDVVSYYDVQVEVGDYRTPFEPFSDIVFESPDNTDGVVEVPSTSSCMTILTDTPGVIVEAEYNRDTTKMFESYVLTDEAKNEIAGIIGNHVLTENDKVAIAAMVENDMAEVLATLNSYAESVIGGE